VDPPSIDDLRRWGAVNYTVGLFAWVPHNRADFFMLGNAVTW
jgi:hypothetical protein